MTGRRAGYCAGYDAPGWASPIPGRGLGLGWARGGGWRHRNWYSATGVPGWGRFSHAPAWGAPPAWAYGPYAAAPSREQEAESLKQQAEWLKDELDAIARRIEELTEQD
jgi:hypothetical protein